MKENNKLSFIEGLRNNYITWIGIFCTIFISLASSDGSGNSNANTSFIFCWFAIFIWLNKKIE